MTVHSIAKIVKCTVTEISELLQESAKKYEGLFPGHETASSARVGLAYAKSVEGAITGQVIIIS